MKHVKNVNNQTKQVWGSILLLTAIMVLSACGGDNTTPTNNGEISDNVIVEDTPVVVEYNNNETAENNASDEPTPAESGDAPGSFLILANQSEVRFLIDEVLFGQDKTVVGTTQTLSGEVTAELSDPRNSQVSVSVDLSTLVTDSNRRTTTLRNNILEANKPQYQYGTFVSTEFFGLPENAEVGASYKVSITGELTVHEVTQTVTFEGSVTVESETRLSGSFEALILWNDYVSVFRLPDSVASVEDEVILQIDFVAER